MIDVDVAAAHGVPIFAVLYEVRAAALVDDAREPGGHRLERHVAKRLDFRREEEEVRDGIRLRKLALLQPAEVRHLRIAGGACRAAGPSARANARGGGMRMRTRAGACK